MIGSRRSGAEGFTLVEIAVAVAILGVALVTLVGLHTRMLDTYFNERNRLRASLYAQYLMTMIEVEPDAPEPETSSGDLLSELEDAGYFGGTDFERPDPTIADWTLERTVESIGLPLASDELAEDALRRIDLTITWGTSDEERYNLVYFVNPVPEAASSFGGVPGGGLPPTGQPGAAPGRPQPNAGGGPVPGFPSAGQGN